MAGINKKTKAQKCAPEPIVTITANAVYSAVADAVGSWGAGVVLRALMAALDGRIPGEACPDRKRVMVGSRAIVTKAHATYSAL
jgi:hypothetical protein